MEDCEARRIGLLDQRQHEGIEGGGALGLIARFVGLCARRVGLPQRHSEPDAERDQRRAASGHWQSISLNEFAQSISAAVGLRLHRLAVEQALEVIGQCGSRLVALGRLALESLGDHGVKIAFERFGAMLVARGFARLSEIATEQFGFERTLIAGAIQAGAGDQFEQHDAERVDIGRHRDRQRRAPVRARRRPRSADGRQDASARFRPPCGCRLRSAWRCRSRAASAIHPQ